MNNELINWDLYEIYSSSEKLNGVMLRGRIRKLCLKNKLNIIIDNATDKENTVRFCVFSKENISIIKKYLDEKFDNIKIKKIKEKINNPVLSKLKVNLENRYTL